MDPCLDSGRLVDECGHRRRVTLTAALALLLFAPAVDAEPVSIEHRAVGCFVAGKYPVIDACFSPSEEVARARVYFRGDGIGDWYYVDMKPEESCFRGILPRPRASLHTVSYYVSATDREFTETRTEEFGPVVMEGEGKCENGLVAPVVSSATVLVGALSGAAVPAGFLGGGLLGLGAGAAAASVVGAGAVTGAIIAGTGDSETTTTTTPRPTPTPIPTPRPTPTPTPRPTPTPEPTPTPPSGSCLPDDSGPPDLTILAPADNADVGAVVDISVQATDPGPVSSGIDVVVITADEQGGSRTDEIAAFHEPGPLFQVSWMVPPCVGPQDRWYIDVRAIDHCDRRTSERIRVRRTMASCGTSPPPAASDGSEVWTSELSVSEGRAQVVLDGSQAIFPGPGRALLLLAAAPGRHRVEATLVSGRGPGSWRFAPSAGNVRPGSLLVLGGDVASIGPDALTFRLAGRPGERVVFTFESVGSPSGPSGTGRAPRPGEGPSHQDRP